MQNTWNQFFACVVGSSLNTTPACSLLVSVLQLCVAALVLCCSSGSLVLTVLPFWSPLKYILSVFVSFDCLKLWVASFTVGMSTCTCARFPFQVHGACMYITMYLKIASASNPYILESEFRGYGLIISKLFLTLWLKCLLYWLSHLIPSSSTFLDWSEYFMIYQFTCAYYIKIFICCITEILIMQNFYILCFISQSWTHVMSYLCSLSGTSFSLFRDICHVNIHCNAGLWNGSMFRVSESLLS